MAFIAMHACWGKAVGIGVDTHVHRIANRLRWVRTTTPEQTRDHLQALLPRAMWGGINILLVGFGQQVCLPLAPRCSTCAISGICPSSEVRGAARGGGGGGGGGGETAAVEELVGDATTTAAEEGPAAAGAKAKAKARKTKA